MQQQQHNVHLLLFISTNFPTCHFSVSQWRCAARTKGREIPRSCILLPEPCKRLCAHRHAKKNTHKKSEPLCKAITLFTSRCVYKEWRGKNGNVRKNVKCLLALSAVFQRLKCSLQGRGSWPRWSKVTPAGDFDQKQRQRVRWTCSATDGWMDEGDDGEINE